MSPPSRQSSAEQPGRRSRERRSGESVHSFGSIDSEEARAVEDMLSQQLGLYRITTARTLTDHHLQESTPSLQAGRHLPGALQLQAVRYHCELL